MSLLVRAILLIGYLHHIVCLVALGNCPALIRALNLKFYTHLHSFNINV